MGTLGVPIPAGSHHLLVTCTAGGSEGTLDWTVGEASGSTPYRCTKDGWHTSTEIVTTRWSRLLTVTFHPGAGTGGGPVPRARVAIAAGA